MKKKSILLLVALVGNFLFYVAENPAVYCEVESSRTLRSLGGVGSSFEELLANYTSFVVVVPSYNNKRWCVKNIKSILDQQYDHYRVLVIDDHSSDDQIKLIKDIIVNHPAGSKVRVIENHQRFGAMPNHYYAAQLCEPWEVIIDVDGDDWLYDNQVLNYLNTVYQDRRVWLTYGSYEVASNRHIPSCSRVLPQSVMLDHSYRQYPFITTHLRTYYAGLFHKINIKDLFYRGVFFASSCDIGYMMPMIEMAHEHAHFIDKPLYVYNAYNPIMDYRVNKPLQDIISWHVRMQKPYKRLHELRVIDNDVGVDVFMISENASTADEVARLRAQLYGAKNIHNAGSFKSLRDAIKNSRCDYIALVPSAEQSSFVDLEYCAQMLNRTQAQVFFLSVSFDAYAILQNYPAFAYPGLPAWQASAGSPVIYPRSKLGGNGATEKNRVTDSVYAWQFAKAKLYPFDIISSQAIWPKKVLVKALARAQSCDELYAFLYAYLAKDQVCLSLLKR